MVECDYCTESFSDESAYLDHLADSHEGELGSIDQRRVADRTGSDGEDSIPLGIIVVGAVIVLSAGIAVYITQLSGASGSSTSADGIEAQSLSASGDSELLAAVEQFPDEGAQHVSAGTEINYAQTPPLSGTHYGRPADGGFYEDSQPYGNLVHSLEHGAVVIYYAPDAINESTTESLREFASTHNGRWRSVIAVPSSDIESSFVLTAWRHQLAMDSYDPETVYAFLSEYIGRGPENPVR
jgi:hypothetical protein